MLQGGTSARGQHRSCYGAALLRGLPCLPGGVGCLDLGRVILKVGGVVLQPGCGRVPPRLGVRSFSLPDAGGQPLQQRDGVGAYRLHGGQRRLRRVGVVVEYARPEHLVVALDARRLLGSQLPDPPVCFRLRVGAMDNDLVGGKLARAGAPLARLRRDGFVGGAQPGGAGGVTGDEGPRIELVPPQGEEIATYWRRGERGAQIRLLDHCYAGGFDLPPPVTPTGRSMLGSGQRSPCA